MKKIMTLSAVAAVGLTGFVLVSNVASAQGFGQGWLRGNGGMASMMSGGLNRGSMSQVMAQALGISQQDLQNQLASGRTMSDIIQAQGLTLDQFHQKMEDQMKAYLQTLVSQGTITQAQADQRMQFIEQMHDNHSTTGTGFGMGMMNHGGGMMGGF